MALAGRTDETRCFGRPLVGCATWKCDYGRDMHDDGGNGAADCLNRVGTEPRLAEEESIWRLATALSSATTAVDVASALAEEGPQAAGATLANMALLDPHTRRVRLVHGSTIDPKVAAKWAEFDISDSTPVCEAMLTGRAVLHRSLDVMRERYPHMQADSRAVSLGATASFPLTTADGISIGAAGFGWPDSQQFDATQVRRLELIVHMAAQSLERAVLYESEQQEAAARERADAQLFQDACLPRVLPESKGLELAAVYLPASDATMGGDWYDVFPVEGGTCLVIGDVAGHGAGSAAVMAQLRNAVRAFADDDPSPSRIVTRLNRMMCRLLPGETASATVAVWDPEKGTILRANAGHPPVLRCRVGEFEYLSRPQAGLLLGVEPRWIYEEAIKVLRPGTTMLFYTDGLVEMRDRSLDDGMNQLRAVAERSGDLEPAALCEEILSWRRRIFRLEDDVCLLAARLTHTRR
ncbi:MAG TPA: GAF domain-containing SpoIIE family protein phosphatase [Acidimicrobiales bacterium]|nr:GAF domain-containing SpoIIE family protein phosphatase [Acidimicrobiales bacterium]